MSLLDDILNNKVSSNNSTEKKSSPRKKLLNDIVNNRVDTTPQSPDMDYSQSMAARLGARNRANLTLGKSNNKMYDFSVSRLETEAFRKYQDSRTANQDYLKAYSDYMKNPNRETKQALDNAKKNRRKKSDAYKLSRSDAMDALAEKNYEEANPLYKAGVKLVEPFINPIVDLTSTITKKKVRDSEGNEKYVDTTGFDAIHKAVTKDDGSLLSKGYNIYNSVVSTATKMAVSGYTGGSRMYYGDMFTDEYKNAINEGNNKANSAAYAAYTTTMGIVLDKIVGNAGKLIGFQNVGDSSATEQVLQAGWSKLINNPKISSILAAASSEGLSEGLEEFVDNIGGFFMLNQDEPRTVESFGNMLKDTMPNAIYSAIVGSIVGGGTDVLTNIDAETKKAITSPETKQAIDSAIEGFENYKPDTVESAEAKERLITNLENTRDTINSLENESAITNENQTAPNTTEQVQDANIQENAPTEKQAATVQETQQPKIIESKEPKKEGQLQFDLDDEIKTKGKEMNLSEEQISYKQKNVKELQNTAITKDTSLEKAIETGNYEITENGDIKKTINEKETRDLINLTIPNDNKITIKSSDIYNNETTIRKPSTKYTENITTNEELFDKLESDKTRQQKVQDKQDSLKMEETYAKRKASIDDDVRLSKYEKTEMNHMFKSLNLNDLEQKWADEVLNDIDNVKELVDKAMLNNEVNEDTVAQSAVLAQYYDSKGMWDEGDVYYQKASSMLHNSARNLVTGKLLYQNNPMGAYCAYMRAVEQTYKDDARYHKNDVEWHRKNDLFNPDGSINKESPYRLSKEVKDEVGAKIQEWYKIEDSNSKEAKIKKKEIDTLLQNNLPKKPRAERFLDFRRSAMLNNIGIWVKNSRQEIVDATNAVVTDVGSTVTDRALSKLRNKIENETRVEQGLEKQNKRYRSTSITTTSGKEFVFGYINGAKNHWNSIFNDVSLNREFTNKYDTNIETKSSEKVGEIGSRINRESTNPVQIFMDKVNAIGMSSDTRFNEGYYASALYDMQQQFARNKASDEGVNAVVRTEIDASGARITYIDSDTMNTQNEIIPSIKTKEELSSYMEEKGYGLPSQKEITDMLDRAADIGQTRTLQGNGAISRATSKLVKGIDNFTIEHVGIPLGSHIAPFLHARSEGLQMLINSTPLAAKQINSDIKAFKQAIRDNASGQNTSNNLFVMQNKIAKETGQALGGTTAMILTGVLVSELAKNGLVVGSNADDKKDEKEYTLKIGDKNYNFDLDTITTNQLKFLSVITDKKNISTKEGDGIIKNIENTLSNFGSPVLDSIFEQTVLSSFGEYMDTKYGSRLDNIGYQLSRIPQSYIPTLSKNVAAIFDGFTARDTSSDTLLGKAVNGIGEKIPFVRSLYEEKKTKWGSPEDATLNIFEKAWNSMISKDISTNQVNKVDKELYELYSTTGSTGLFPSTGLTDTFKRGNNTYKMSDKEQKKYQNTYGKTSLKTLESLMKTSHYKSANNKDKASLIRAVYEYAKTVGQNEYFDSKNISYTQKETAIEKVINQDISYDSAKYQVKNPTRWKLYTSIISDYDDYKSITSRIQEIKDTYNSDNGFNYKTQQNMVINYINGLSGLNATKKAMLIKLSGYKGLYSSYDNRIDDYIKTLHLSDDEYEYFINGSNLGLKGYHTTFYKSKKNK